MAPSAVSSRMGYGGPQRLFLRRLGATDLAAVPPRREHGAENTEALAPSERPKVIATLAVNLPEGWQGGGMHTDVETITSILERYMSRMNARGLLARALQERGLSERTMTREDLVKCSPALRRGIELFVPARLQPEALDRFKEFFRARSESAACRIEVLKESDISNARSEARRLCENAGATAFAMQKVTTIVSELARNIVLYAKTGLIEIGFDNRESKSKIVIKATDKGSGIPNLERILSGQYQSRTGLGKGILGSKRLADQFHISTGDQGTSITAEVAL